MSVNKLKKKSVKKNISSINCANNTALITGGSKRLGRAIAIRLAELNYDVVITYNNSKDEAEKLSKLIEKKYLVKTSIFKVDLRKHKEVKALLDFMVANFGNWNLLINNASIFNTSKFLANDDCHEWQDNLSIHLLSPIFLIKEFAKQVLKNKVKDAQVINMLDKNIARHDTKYFYYLLTKKFLATATKMIALEIAPNVRINGIAPGKILGNINNKSPQKELEVQSKIVPLKKIGDVENIIQSLEFLIKNNFITGQIISIDGGSSLNHAG